MRRDGRAHRPWRRKEQNPAKDPTLVFQELQRRQLRDLETCRLVWESEQDPLALCEAVRQSALPDWLSNALLVMLTDGLKLRDDEGNCPTFQKRLWRDRTRNAIDRERAQWIAGFRHPDPDAYQIWESAFRLADLASHQRHGSSMPTGQPAGLKRAYERVCAGLNNVGRYYCALPGLHERILSARAYMLGLIEASLSQADGARK